MTARYLLIYSDEDGCSEETTPIALDEALGALDRQRAILRLEGKTFAEAAGPHGPELVLDGSPDPHHPRTYYLGLLPD